MSLTENARDKDEEYMRLALKLAAKGTPSPNPYVGAVIVKDGKVVGRGFHRKAGMAHAEVEAIKDAGAEAKGATLYVNVEPCNHHGRTPPCTGAIAMAGISKVVFAMKDPNPDVKGGGEEELLKNGIEVKKGVMEKEALRLNEVFVKYAKTKVPFATVKAAMSMDGRIATRTGDSKWITDEKARRYAHKLRSMHDAVLVGIGTVIKDDPQLTARIPGGRNPVRVVLDDTLRVPLGAKALADSNVIIATSEKCNEAKKKEIEAKGAKVFVCGKERVDLRALLAKLGEMGITSVLVEGGSEVQGSFIDQRLADKVVLFYAPKIIGGRDAKPAFGGRGAERVSEAVEVRDFKMKRLGNGFLLEGYSRYL